MPFQLYSEEEEETHCCHYRAVLQTHHHLAQVPAKVLAHVLQGMNSAGPGEEESEEHVR